MTDNSGFDVAVVLGGLGLRFGPPRCFGHDRETGTGTGV